MTQAMRNMETVVHCVAGKVLVSLELDDLVRLVSKEGEGRQQGEQLTEGGVGDPSVFTMK